MSVFTIQTSLTEEIYSFEQTFEGKTYRLRFRWNRRADLWFLDIRLSDDTPVQLGAPVVLGTFLTRLCRTANTLPGDFLASETDSVSREAGKNELGERVKLYYLERASLVSLSEGGDA